MKKKLSKINKDIIFDIGANEGNDGLAFSLLFRDCNIYAFEPNKKLTQIIKSNQKKLEKKIGFKLKNYEIINKAISKKNKKINFYISKNIGAHSLFNFSKNLHNFKRSQEGYEIVKKTKVDVIKLSTFLRDKKFRRIRYLHCDAQGSDIDVLKGLEKYIKYLNFGVVEVSAKKKRDLYDKSNNNLINLKKFFKKKNFIISKIETWDIYGNELNINFKNKTMINKEFLNIIERLKLRFYQKFIRKIIMNHRKVFLYQLIYKLLNAKYH
ncbi:FkbM family methyltransferase [Candidatus Pelagibacter sp.]|nr:FkbM family methyltransferase [Candidatus Pelagibacter sp.]